jgi:hypothetical protein
MRPPSASQILCLALFVVLAGATILWIALDRTPPNWDDAWYLTNSLNVYDALTQHGVLGFLRSLNTVFGFKAPLIAALPTPFYLVFGRRWHAAYLVNITAMLVLFAALYLIARRWWNSRVAVLAVAIAGCMPLLYGLARWYLVDYTLAAFVAVAIAILLEAEPLDRPARAMMFGAICGLGLLLKAAFALFVLPAFLFAWFGSRQRTRSLLYSGLPCLILALPWYAGHWRATLANALDAGFGAPAAVQGTGAVWSFRAMATYLGRVANDGVSVYFAILASGLILWIAVRRRVWPQMPRMLWVWLLPFAIFLFGGNKDVRYIAPLLPACALLIAALLDSILPRTRIGNILGALVLAYPIVSFCGVSFGVPFRAHELAYSRRFNRNVWPHDEMLSLVAARIPAHSSQRPMVLVAVDRGSLNANNIELTAVALHLPIDVETTAHEQNRGTLISRLEQSAFLLYEEGGAGESRVFNPYIGAVLERARSGGLFTEIPYGRRLPDGGVVRLLERTSNSSAGHAPPEEFFIDFGGIVALTGEVVTKADDFATVNYRWRATRPDGHEYWSFTHLIDPSGRIVAQLDQRLPLAGSDISGLQEIPLGLPTGASSSSLRLRIGVYDPPSGTRLRIAPLSGAPATRFTLADQNTALITPY